MRMGRTQSYMGVPGLDEEIDRIHQFLNFLSDDISPKDIGEPNAGLGHITKALQIGDGPDSPVISQYMTIKADDVSRTVPANGRLYHSVADSDFPILADISAGVTIGSLYRDPWNTELQLTHSKAGAAIGIRLTNDTVSDITIGAGHWYITLIIHQE